MTDPVVETVEHAQAQHKPVQNVVVASLCGIIAILVVCMVGLLIYFSLTLNRRAVAQEAVKCFSEKQAQFSRGITKALAGSKERDEAKIDRGLADLKAIKYEDCK